MDTEFVLVDKYDNIRNKTTLSAGVGISGARTYFMKIKQIDEEGFDKVWKVMTMEQYDRIQKQSLRNNGSRQIEWWKEEGDYLDVEKS
tara:strand:+ start:49 stop:312 length:264 start_codon:yes stop_codon:yes gene_type:complete